MFPLTLRQAVSGPLLLSQDCRPGGECGEQVRAYRKAVVHMIIKEINGKNLLNEPPRMWLLNQNIFRMFMFDRNQKTLKQEKVDHTFIEKVLNIVKERVDLSKREMIKIDKNLKFTRF